MTFTFAALGGTLLVAGLPNALGIVTSDIDKVRPEVIKNISANGDPYTLKKDLGRLRSGLRWAALLLVCQLLIWFMVFTLAIGPLWVLAKVDRALHPLSWWGANYNSILQWMQALANANADIFDRIIGCICLIVAAVLWYWRGWLPFIKGWSTARKARNALKRLEGG